jgi:hypothetical protein
VEHRAKLLDIAAFLDRVGRCRPDSDDEDFRLTALKDAIALLADGDPERTRRILDLLSDQTMQPIARAHTKGAAGADPDRK